MGLTAALVAAVALLSPPAIVTQQATSTAAIPVRVTWDTLNQDGYAQVTFFNDSPLIVTAWAVGMSITRPDGSTTAAPLRAGMDAIGSLVYLRSHPNAPPGKLLLPSRQMVYPVRIGTPSSVASFTLTLVAVAFEDGSVLGDRESLARMLAQREANATAAEQWHGAFEAALAAKDRSTSVGILQRALNTLPADGVTVTLKGQAQQAIAQQTDKARFRAALADALGTATAGVVECRRHLKKQ